MIYNEEYETLPREALEALQLKRLQQVVNRVYHHVGFYKKSFYRAGVHPNDIRTLDDLKRFPFTTKQDLRDNYPFGMFATPMSNIVRLHASSGTTGSSTVVAYTKRDIENWAELVARCFAAADLTRGDIIHNAYGYGLFTGGLGVHYGAEKLGASVIPMSGGNTKWQLMILQDFGPTAICCTPSYALNLAEQGRAMGIDMPSLKLRVGIFGAEPWSEQMRAQIEEAFAIKAMNIYGLSEIMGPGVSMECSVAQAGMHVFEDYFLVETIKPDTGEVLPPGEQGELVFTTLTKEAFPLIRYRTGYITRLTSEPCICGRTNMRMDRIAGRVDDMLIIRGVNVFPSQVESVLLMSPRVEPHYRMVVSRKGALDNLEVQVEISPDLYQEVTRGILSTDDVSTFTEHETLVGLKQNIQKNIKDIIGINVGVTFKEPGSIERAEGKSERVIDLRKE